MTTMNLPDDLPVEEARRALDRVFSRPFKRMAYEDSRCTVMLEEIYPEVDNDPKAEVNIFGDGIRTIEKVYSSYNKIPSLKKIVLKDVFVTGNVIFDLDGNVYEDSYRFGPKSRYLDSDPAVSLGFFHFVFPHKLRLALKQAPICSCRHGFFMNIARWPIFGHFLAETASRLWDDIPKDANMLVSRSWPQYLNFYLHALGADPDMVLTYPGIVYCEKLSIYSQSIILHDAFHPIAKKIYQKFRANDNFIPERIYMSRSKYDRRSNINEHKIEKIAQKYGFTVIHPQELPMDEQNNIGKKAKFIVGCIGSHLLHRLGNEDCYVLHLVPKGFGSENTNICLEKAYNKSYDVIYGEFEANSDRWTGQWSLNPDLFEHGLNKWLEARI